MGRGSKDQGKVTSKLQVALTTHIATLHGIARGDPVRGDGDVIHIFPARRKP